MKHTKFEKNYMKGAAPFYENLAKNETINFNGTPIFKEEYKLMISKRDFSIYSIGMKPNRHWSFNETKKYYGLSGNKAKVAEDIKQLFEDFKEFKSRAYWTTLNSRGLIPPFIKITYKPFGK